MSQIKVQINRSIAYMPDANPAARPGEEVGLLVRSVTAIFHTKNSQTKNL